MKFLALCNIAASLLGFLVAAYMARILGPANLGIAAIIMGINSAFLAFIDFRLNDLAAKAFYDTEGVPSDRVPGYKSGVIWLGILGNTLVCGLTAVLGAAAGNVLIPYFTDAPTEAWWLPVSALSLAVTSISGTMSFMARFTERFYHIGVFAITLRLLVGGISVLIVLRLPHLGGYYLAELSAALLGLALTLGFNFFVWKRLSEIPITRPEWSSAWGAFRKNQNMVFYGNFLGYAKLLQRTADVLFVGYFAGDRETGIYKLARMVVDRGLGVLQEALVQVYYPRLLKAFTLKDSGEFRIQARYLLKTGILATVILVGGEALALPWVLKAFFGAEYEGSFLPILILSATFIFIVGFHPWQWALFVGANMLRPYTIIIYGAVAFQYAVTLLLFQAAGPTALTAMAGACAYYLVSVPALYLASRRRFRDYLPP